MNKLLNVVLVALLTSAIMIGTSYGQNLIEPGVEFNNTDHLSAGERDYVIMYERTGWETHQTGEMQRHLLEAGDSLILITHTIKGKIKSEDTTVMNRHHLNPISFTSRQSDRTTRYTADTDRVNAEVHFDKGGEVLKFERVSDQSFFDISALELVLGAVNRRQLKGSSVQLFDSQTSSFVDFNINEVERENIRDASDNRQRCWKINGVLNRAKATFWIDRKSGELVKSHLEMAGSMAMVVLKK